MNQKCLQAVRGYLAAFAACCFLLLAGNSRGGTPVPSPFQAAKGVYQGLFFETNGAAFQSSGFVTASVSANGAFSGKIQFLGKSYSGSGRFSDIGSYSNSIARPGLSPLQVQLQLDLNGGDLITGQVGDGIQTAELTAFREVYSRNNPAPHAGKYTLVLPGEADSSVQPGGESIGTVTVDRSGKIQLKGLLADGAKISQKTFVSGRGQWPFYASLYSGKGVLLGWLTFTNRPDRDLEGLVSWIKLPQVKAKLYPAGFAFTNGIEAVGSAYAFTNGVRVLNFSDGIISFANGNLPRSFTNGLVLETNQRATGSNNLSLKITTSSGLFKGRVVDPQSARTISFTGVVLQKQNIGAGFFTGTNQSGRVFLSE